jgi:hypothetical protein
MALYSQEYDTSLLFTLNSVLLLQRVNSILLFQRVLLFATYQSLLPGAAGLGGVPEVRAPRYRVTFAFLAPAGHIGHCTVPMSGVKTLPQGMT